MQRKPGFRSDVRDFARQFWSLHPAVKFGALGVLGLFLLIGLVSAVSDEGGSDQASARDDENTPHAALATSTPRPTETGTPKPTNTPVPPTPTATPTPRPEPVELSGTGAGATGAVKLGTGIWVVASSHTGTSNFIVYAYDEAGSRTLVANTIGTSASTRALVGGKSYRFDIQATGPWTIHAEPIALALEHALLFAGKGDGVSGLFMPVATGPKTFAFTHTGRSNFIVRMFCDKGTTLAQNVIGVVDASRIVSIPNGATACYWEVQADGEWSIRLTET